MPITSVSSEHNYHLHAKRGTDEVVDGRHLAAVKVNGNEQQHASE